MTSAKTNIILIGFMGSGKSTVGKKLADMLGFSLLDLDALIEEQEEMSISQIFTEHKEDYFRALEHQAIIKLKESHSLVLVTGGGTPTFFAHAQILSDMGHIFFLDANFALIEQRLSKSKQRPLGSVDNKDNLTKTKKLYIFRRPIYQNLGHIVDVNINNIDNISHEITARYKALCLINNINNITIHQTDDKYGIFCERQSLSQVANILTAGGLKYYRPVIVTTNNLKNILNKAIETITKSLGIIPALITFNDGEQYKNLHSVHDIHNQMFNLGLTRNTVILALGGGNVGDVAGLAAGLYMRGMPYVQIPSTLLAMVDASIGGKTGVDNEWGKNLIGLFYNPKAVIIDPDLLDTLSEDDFSCGMAETIKHAIIGDRKLFFDLKKPMDISDIIARSINVKAKIVFLDPKEQNLRAHLNLGHTYAHAIEKVSNYAIKHGHAVSIGLVLATNLSKRLGLLEEDMCDDLISLLKQHNLPIEMPKSLNNSHLLSAMQQDKKRDDNGIRFVLPKKIGEVGMQYVEPKDVF